MTNETIQEKVDSAAKALFDLAEKMRGKCAPVVQVVEPVVDFSALSLAVEDLRSIVSGEAETPIISAVEPVNDDDGGTPEVVEVAPEAPVSDMTTTAETEPLSEVVEVVAPVEVTEQTESVSVS